MEEREIWGEKEALKGKHEDVFRVTCGASLLPLLFRRQVTTAIRSLWSHTWGVLAGGNAVTDFQDTLWAQKV